MSTTQKIHKISLVVDAQTRQLRSVSNEFKALEREIARVTGKVDVMGTHFKANEAKMQKAMRTTTNASKTAHTSMGNDIVRHIRRVESLVVALYAVKKAYDVTLGRGHEFNKLIEQETTGLKLLIAQNLSHKDSLGNILSPMQKFTIAQKEATKAINIAREVNLQTPHSFSETMQIYKLLTPQVLKYGGTLEQTGKIAKNVSIVASAMGVEFQQLLKTVDSAMTGEAKESGLKRALAQFGITNELIKSTMESGGSVVDLFINKLENADVAGIELATNWQGVTAKFLNVWDEMFARVQKPIFDGMKRDIAGVASYIKDNSASIVSNLQTLGTVALEVGKAFVAWKIGGALIGKIKAIQFGMARMTVMAKQTNGALSTMDLRLMKLETSFRRVAGSMKKMFLANAPLIAMMAVYEAWNFITGQIADKEERLAGILKLKAVEVAKLTKMQQQDTLNKLKSSLHDHKQIGSELRTQLTIAGHKLDRDSEEYVAIRAKWDAHVAVGKEIKTQITTISSVIDGTYKAGEAVYAVADGAKLTGEELQKASDKAFTLANALGSAVVGMETQLIKAKEIAGIISETTSVKMVADVNLSDVKRQMEEINGLYAVKGANIDELNVKAIKAYEKELSLQNGLAESLKSIEERKRRESKKTSKASEKGLKDEAKALKATMDLYKQYLTLTGQRSELFQLDVSETMDEFLKDGTYTMKQLSDIYDGMWKKYEEDGKKANKDIAMDFTNQFKGLLEGIFDGDFGGAIKGFFDGVGTEIMAEPIKKMSDSLSGSMTSLFSGLGDFGGILGGLAMSGIGMLFDSLFSEDAPTPPELEDIAKTSDSMANALKHIEDAQYPMLQLTRDMKGYLGVIANSFGAIENSLLRSDKDFAGNFYQDQVNAGSYSSKTYTLQGTTLDFESASIAEIMSEQLRVERDTIIKKVYDSFWKTKTTYFHNYENVSDLFSEDIANATKSLFGGFSAIGDAIGINIDGMMNEVIDIGKIDTTGKSSQEIAEEIEARFSAQTDAIAEKYLGVVAEFQKAGEGLAETAFRVALNFDQVSHSMGLIGKSVDWRTANIIEQVAGGLDMLGSSMSSYQENFFTDAERYEMKLNTMTKSFASLGLAIPDSNAEFRNLIEGIDTTTDAGATLFAEVISLAGGFADMTSSVDSLGTSLEDMIKNVSDAWLGNLSYLTMQQKADFASATFALARQSNGVIDPVDSARAMAETALKVSTTKEEYVPYFNQYVQALQDQAPEATTDDVLAKLNDILGAIEDGSYQAPLENTYYEGVRA